MRWVTGVILFLLLSTSGWAQSAGVLYCLDAQDRGGTAYLETDQGPLECHVDAGQLRAMQERGLGSSWHVYTRGKDVTSALCVSSDANASAALALVRAQIGRLNAGRFEMPTPTRVRLTGRTSTSETIS